jgi:integrase/recombinase XerD
MPHRSRQYADRVNVVKYVKVGDGWRFAKVAEQNGKIVRDHVLISGRDELHREGTYYIEWYVRGIRRRKAVFQFSELINQARRKALEVAAMAAGMIRPETRPVSHKPAQVPIGAAIDKYLDYIDHHRSRRTYQTYRYTLDKLLRQSYTKTYIEEVDREDILKFMTDCYRKNLGRRTVYGKLVVVLQMFKRYGKTKLIEPSDWPDYVETIRPIYEQCAECCGLWAGSCA